MHPANNPLSFIRVLISSLSQCLIDVGHRNSDYMWALSKHKSRPPDVLKCIIQSSCPSCSTLYQLKLFNIMQGSKMQLAAISSVFMGLAPATFLITHPYYYFVLLSVSVSVSLLFWSHTQILKYPAALCCWYRLS